MTREPRRDRRPSFDERDRAKNQDRSDALAEIQSALNYGVASGEGEEYEFAEFKSEWKAREASLD